MTSRELRPALFLDRDGTLIVDAHYLADASRVRLLPGVAEAVRAANAADVPVFIITNQSGIGRGLITRDQYEAVRARTEALLHDAGARVTATYHCPHTPDDAGCRCRKPATGMYEQAAADHGLVLTASAYVGDRWRDAEPALRLGGVGILVPGAETPPGDVESARSAADPSIHLAADLTAAVGIALAHMAESGSV